MTTTTDLKLSDRQTRFKDSAEGYFQLTTTVTAGAGDQQVDLLIFNPRRPQAEQITISAWVSPAGRLQHLASAGTGYSWKRVPLSHLNDLMQSISGEEG